MAINGQNFAIWIKSSLRSISKSIFEAWGHPGGQFLAISGHFQPVPAPYIVQDGPDWVSSIQVILGIIIALQKFVLKSISEAERLSRWPILGHFFPFPAISGPVYGLRWSRLCLNRPFHIGNHCCSTKFCPKIDIWGWRSSRWPSLGRFRPPSGRRWSSPKQKLIRI